MASARPMTRGSMARPDGVAVLAQEPVTEGVEGVDGRVRLAIGHEQVDARLHLVRGALREREGQDLRRRARDGWR